MKKPYIVVLGDGFPRKELLDEISKDSRFGSWFYSMPNSFIVYSTVDSNAIDKFVKGFVGDKYRYFIAEVGGDRQGWMPREHWDVIRQQGAEKLFSLDFTGYYMDPAKLPDSSGVCCAYNCNYSESENSVKISSLLYIGSATNVRAMILDNALQEKLRADCEVGQRVCYSVAPVTSSDLDWCVAALKEIADYRHKGEELLRYDFSDSFVVTSGQNFGLRSGVLAERRPDARG